MEFLGSDKVKNKIKILSLLGIIHKSSSKSIELSSIQEKVMLTKLETDLLIMKCLRMK